MVIHRRSLTEKLIRYAAEGGSRTAQAAVVGLELYADLIPGVRMAGARRLPENFGAGLLAAEVTTWAALSPSLLPRPWWVTALNVAICQGVGHAAGAGFHNIAVQVFRLSGFEPSAHVSRRTHKFLHAALAAGTVVSVSRALLRQDKASRLVNKGKRRGRAHLAAGIFAGTAGYGALLLAAEGAQSSINRTYRTLRRWLPPLVSWPLAVASFSIVTYVTTQQVLVRRLLNGAARRARELNSVFFPGVHQPKEKERSGSVHSEVGFHSVGAQGRVLLSIGPRAQDIEQLTGIEGSREPIRIFVGLRKDRSFEKASDAVLREMDRTGAWERSCIVMMSSAGTGWITDWSVSSLEFLAGGDCASVAIQYSYLPSALSYMTDEDSPVESSRILFRKIEARLAEMNEADRPRLYVAGESLGAYGIADSFNDVDDLIARVDGGVLSGPPRFTRLHWHVTRSRDPGSPERLPIIDGGRHLRFAAHPNHIEQDFSGRDFAHDWEHPRIVIPQHASDPIVFWHPLLFLRPPGWLREPGSRGISAPAAQRLDVFDGLKWFPFVTGWQVGLDQVTSLDVPGGHGHNYHAEMLWYWAGVLGPYAKVTLDNDLAERLERWIYSDHIDR